MTNKLVSVGAAWASMLLTLAALAAGDGVRAAERPVAHKSFASAEEAASALGAAYENNDRDAEALILGDDGWRIVFSGDPVIDRLERRWFLSLYREAHAVAAEAGDSAVLELGRDAEPYPIPIVKTDEGWRFDSHEGHEELLSRRISKAELTALNMVVAYVDAQREYVRADHDGDGVREYAQRIGSAPGQHDGLWWRDRAGQAAGPIAGLIEAAHEEGYQVTHNGQLPVYRGYVYKILTSQGPHAVGGARDYLVDGRMTRGFALVAFPVRYGVSGVLTFMVNQEGVVYQKDLGADTVAQAAHMTAFDPDPSWEAGQAN